MNLSELYERAEYAKIIKQVSDEHPDTALEIKARALQKLKRFEEAMQLWNILIVRNGKQAEYFNERGVCKFNMGFKHALADFDTAILLAPSEAYFYACRAYVKDKMGNPEGAVEDYQHAHELDPEDAITLNNLGLAEQKLGHTQKARDFFRKSNDLLGLSTTEDYSEPDFKPKAITFSDKIREMRKMFSSRKEFMSFVREARKNLGM